jgi:hypothetical protein
MRIRTTALDAFQYYLDNDIDQESYIQSITDFKSTPAMEIGKAYENIITNPKPYDKYLCYKYDDYSFDNEIIGEGTNFIRSLDFPCYQVKSVKNINVIKLVGVADIINGNEIIDVKTTGRFDIERYFKSWQWRAYLDIFELDKFRYFVVEYNLKENSIYHKDTHKFEFFRYDNMTNELSNIVSQFAEFISNNNLDNYFKDK